MRTLKIESTANSPEVIFDVAQKLFMIKGKSVLNNVDEIYDPVLDWLNEYQFEEGAEMEFVFDMEYFNISSSKRILFVLYKLNEMLESGLDVKVFWYHNKDDNDMKEVGEDFEFMVNVPFCFYERAAVKLQA